MFPFAFEWHWDIGHLVFFGVFYAALTVIGITLVATIIKTAKDLASGHGHGHHDEENEAPAEAAEA